MTWSVLGPDRRANDLDPGGGEDLVEGVTELGVAIVDEEPGDQSRESAGTPPVQPSPWRWKTKSNFVPAASW